MTNRIADYLDNIDHPSCTLTCSLAAHRLDLARSINADTEKKLKEIVAWSDKGAQQYEMAFRCWLGGLFALVGSMVVLYLARG